MAEEDEALLDKYLSGEKLSEDEIISCIRKATIARNVVPVLLRLGFPQYGMSSPCLTQLSITCASPVDMRLRPWSAMCPAGHEDELVTLRMQRQGIPLPAWSSSSFRIPSSAIFSFFRIYSGFIGSGMTVLNANTGKKERIGRLLKMHANKR